MHFERLTEADDARLPDAMRLYGESFPLHEQRLQASQKAVLQNEAYHFDLIYDGADWVGLLLNWETEDFIYVEHFCILPEKRNHRCGERALSLLRGRGKTVILEIDPPEDEISRRRRGFYVRCGYRENPFSHVHPPYRQQNEGHRLTVMSCPEALTQAGYDRFAQYLSGTVMTDCFTE